MTDGTVVAMQRALWRECIAEMHTESDGRSIAASMLANQVQRALDERGVPHTYQTLHTWISASVGTHTPDTLADAYLTASKHLTTEK